MMLNTVSAEPCRTYFRKKKKKTCPQTFTPLHHHLFLLPHRPAPTQPVKPRMRRRLRENSAVQRPDGRLVFSADVNVALQRDTQAPRRASVHPQRIERCEAAENTQEVMHPTRHAPRPPPPKQLDSHPVIQSDCPAAPFAISAYVCFAAARRPGERSVTSFGNTRLVWKVRKSEVKQKQRLRPREAFRPFVFVFV